MNKIKVLVVEEKQSTRIFNISTLELRGKVFLKLFRERKDAGYYDELLIMESKLLEEAKTGNVKSAERIILSRGDYEYEYVGEVDVENV